MRSIGSDSNTALPKLKTSRSPDSNCPAISGECSRIFAIASLVFASVASPNFSPVFSNAFVKKIVAIAVAIVSGSIRLFQ
ncbi:MAG: hypothetical protein LH649_05205 [Pseudanabaena sp. CAN_BIN31]|nr:hypothetical protein [Pseudanabaena sp. CAN_BIN31]